MVSFRRSFVFAWLAFITPAAASDISVAINDGHGGAVEDAVVVVTTNGAGRTDRPASETKIINQQNETFIPYVEVLRPGDKVIFKNSDRIMHHVYSFSPIKSFEYVVAAGTSSPPVVLDQPGVIAVGCNIHDHMITYLLVSDAPWVAKSASDGTVAFRNLAAGLYTVTVWHPQQHPAKPEIQQTVSLGGGGDTATLTFSLSLLPDPRSQVGRDEGQY